MQKYKVVNQANADGTAKDGTINDPTSGTKITASFLNDNFFNIFSFLENAGYTLIDDDLSQLTKALKGRYVSTYTYNTSSITTQSVNDVVFGSDGQYYEVQNNNVTNDDPVGSTTGNWALTSNSLLQSIPVGATLELRHTNIPDGWLYCNHQEVSRAQYPTLFNAIGTTYGAGNGSTTFRLPDDRGVFKRGWDDGRGLDSGRAFGSYQADEFKSHNHFGRLLGNNVPADYGSHSNDSGVASGYTGSTGGNETRSKNNSVIYIIKY